MKVLKVFLAAMVLFLTGILEAQVSVSVNIGSPPPWGPVGYSNVQYYYLPDVEAYYDVKSSMFIYYGAGAWVHRPMLPSRYRGYDLYHGYKVVMTDYHGNAPYAHFKEHKMKYGKGYHGNYQKTIGEKPGNSSHDKKEGHGGNGKGNGHGNDKKMKEGHGHGDGNGKMK